MVLIGHAVALSDDINTVQGLNMQNVFRNVNKFGLAAFSVVVGKTRCYLKLCLCN